MTTVSKWKIDDKQRPTARVGDVYAIVWARPVVSGDAAQNDDITVVDLPVNHRIMQSEVEHDGTLGASATAKLRVGSTAITGATSAGAASQVRQNAVAPASRSAEQAVNILIEGAGITASTTLRATLLIVVEDEPR